MKSLLWKEVRENFKWVPIPILLILCPTALMGPYQLMDMGRLLYISIVAALFGAVLGFLQMFPESQGDKRSLLLHRPMSRSQIFLGKVLAGVGLYLLALGAPLAWAVGLAVTPGHLAQPFRWPMALPWLADILTGLVYYFAGMLMAQREARWYGSRCLPLGAGLFCSIVVWAVPEFWYALLAIVFVGGAGAVAAWGSFSTGGAYAMQPRLARIALAFTLLMGLSVIGFLGKSQFGRWWTDTGTRDMYLLDREGRVLDVHQHHDEFSVTDLEGQSPRDLQGERLDYHALLEMEAPQAAPGGVDLAVRRSYRSCNRSLVKYANDSKPGNEVWWYVPDQGWLRGYDRQTKRLIGTFGPRGFVPPGAEPSERFQGPLFHYSTFPEAMARDYLAFPGGVYAVDFRTRSVHPLFIPAHGQTVLWASRWEDKPQKVALAFVGTDRSIDVVDESGSGVFSMPLAYDLASYQLLGVGRLENPRRYWVWFEPQWYLEPETLQTMSAYLVEYSAAGHETSRRTIPLRLGDPRHDPRMLGFEPTHYISLSGLVTPPGEVAVLAGAKQYLVGEVRRNNGREMWPFVSFLFFSTQFYLPSFGYLPRTPANLTFGFASLMLLAAMMSGLVGFLLLRRHAFAPSVSITWALCGLLWGPNGLLLLLAVQEWPARLTCPKCRQFRVVTRDTCEHCGALHASPAPDGTEIFEPTAAARHPALIGR